MNLLFAIIFFFIILLINIFLLPLIQFQSWYSWWNTYDPQKKYTCFSITSLAYYKYNNIAYEIYKLLTPKPNQFTYDWWALFLSSIMAGEAFGVVPNGLCTPKTLCYSLIPGDFPNNPLPPNNVRKWPETYVDWQNLLLAWLGFESTPLQEEDWKPDLNKWDNSDNFLAKWGITPNSPCIIGFVTNWSIYKNDPLYPTILNPLLGIQGGIGGFQAGGWLGFLQQGQDFNNLGLLEANRVIWSSEPIPSSIQKAQNESKCNTAAITSGSISMAIGLGFLGLTLAPFTGGLSTGLCAGIGGLIGAAGGGLLTASSTGCI